MKKEIDHTAILRKRLLSWHYQKSRTVGIIDLLESTYQQFRRSVSCRLGKDVDFRTAIRLATLDELQRLENIRDELRLGI